MNFKGNWDEAEEHSADREDQCRCVAQFVCDTGSIYCSLKNFIFA